MFGIPAFYGRGEGQESSGKSVWVVFHEDLIVVTGVTLESGELGDAGVITINFSFGGEAGLSQLRGISAELYDEFPGFRSSSPNSDRAGSGLPEHGAVGQPNGIPVGCHWKKQANGKKRNESQHWRRVADSSRNAPRFLDRHNLARVAGGG